eukprot:1151491-Pelagomonas_calceolata.AAC.1
MSEAEGCVTPSISLFIMLHVMAARERVFPLSFKHQALKHGASPTDEQTTLSRRIPAFKVWSVEGFKSAGYHQSYCSRTCCKHSNREAKQAQTVIFRGDWWKGHDCALAVSPLSLI